MRAVVTGGSGFIGTNLVDALAGDGWQVTNVDIAPPRNPAHHGLWQQVDILDRRRLQERLEAARPEVVFHLAARTDLAETSDIAGYTANVQGVSNVCDAVRAIGGVKRVVFASSQLVCPIGYRPTSDLDVCPTTLYGRSKVLGEAIVRRAGSDLGASWTIVRPTSIWGPWFAEPYRSFFEMIARGQYVHTRDTNTMKQWGYVGNAVYALQALARADANNVHGRVFYIADYEPLELREFANRVQRAMGAAPIRTLPLALLKLAARIGDAARVLGWTSPPLTSFRLTNVLSDELHDTRPLAEAVGPLPQSTDDGIRLTTAWLATHPRVRGTVARAGRTAVGAK